jgi:WD40 repeat protein
MKFNVRHPFLTFVAFAPDGKRLVSAGGSGASNPKDTLWIWDIAARTKTVADCPTTPTCMAFSPNEKYVVCAHGQYISKPPLLSLCDVATGRTVMTIDREEKEDAVAVAVSPDSRLIAAGTPDGLVKLFDASKGNRLASFDDLQADIFAVAFHPKRNLLAATGKDKTIRFWDLESKKLVSTMKLPKLEYHLCLRFSTDGTQVATYTPAGDVITIWSVEANK